ncbi:MAG: hypothetical protein QG657_5209 [Acidobacteriota bacterium]|nr:hypothetical protein [Acidobacteriota bacterium]
MKLKQLISIYSSLVLTVTGSLLFFQRPPRLAAMIGCPDNLLGPRIDWRVQDYSNSQGITAVRYDETEKCLVLDCDLKGKDPHMSQGEIILDLTYIPCLEANTPVNMTGRLMEVAIQIPSGFVGSPSAPNGCQVFAKDTSWRSQSGTWINCLHAGIVTAKLQPSEADAHDGYTEPGFDPTKIRIIGVKFGINSASTFQFKGQIKITGIEVIPSLPFSTPPQLPENLPTPFLTGGCNVDLYDDGFYVGNNKWFIVGGNWRLIEYRQNFGTTAWFPNGNGVSQHPMFIGTKLEWFRQAGITLIRVGLVEDGTTLLNRSGNMVGYNEIFKKDVSKFLELAAQYHVKVEFSLVDFLIAGKEEEVAGVWLKGRREVIEDSKVRQGFIQNFLTPFLQDFGNSPALFGFDIINEPEWIISKDHGGGWEDITDLDDKAETPIPFDQFKSFVTQCTGKIRQLAPGKFVTVGVSCKYIELLNNLNTSLDYNAIHYYPWMGNLTTNLSIAPRDDPWSLEEFPGKGDIYSYFKTVSDNGGAGALMWNLSPEIDDQCYSFEEEAKKLQEIREFSGYLETLRPSISLDRMHLYFSAEISGADTGAQAFLISNSGTWPLHWTVSDDAAWLNCTPASGVGSGKVTVSIDPTDVSAGTYTGSVTVSDSGAANSPQTVSVTLEVKSTGATDAPFGDFSTPLDGSTVQSSIPVTGWALDDLLVTGVKIYLGQNGQLIYSGEAGFIEGARPDVEQAYPVYPFSYRAGWGYMMLTNFLPNRGNDTYVLHAVAEDVEGHQVTLGIKTITCDNAHTVKPFGAIDTPSQGGTVSGNRYSNVGWALTPQPSSIPKEGSTIDVYVDGVKLGHPIYNIYRSDIAALLPGYANSSGAGASFSLDTTAYDNGIHIIHWIALDNAGNSEGIGSRYFTIQNRGTIYSTQQLKAGHPPNDMNRLELSIPGALKQEPGPIEIKIGFTADAGNQVILPDENKIFQVNLRQLERIEIHLDPGNKSTDSYMGYLSVGEQRRSLPVGSTFDHREGIFYWQPGAGFLGDYTFLFLRRGSPRNSDMKRIDIHILPKYCD